MDHSTQCARNGKRESAIHSNMEPLEPQKFMTIVFFYIPAILNEYVIRILFPSKFFLNIKLGAV